MTQPELEPVPEGTGEPIDVRVDASVNDGVFRIDLGVQDTALLTLHFNSLGAGLVDQLLALAHQHWRSAHEQLLAGAAAEAGSDG